MKDVKLADPITVTLKAGEWWWLLGLLSFAANQGENNTLDKLYAQIFEATE